MAPLYVEKECLKCHLKEGYILGEIRGGISVSFDIREILDMQKTNLAIIVALAILTIAGIAGFFLSLHSSFDKENIFGKAADRGDGSYGRRDRPKLQASSAGTFLRGDGKGQTPEKRSQLHHD